MNLNGRSCRTSIPRKRRGNHKQTKASMTFQQPHSYPSDLHESDSGAEQTVQTYFEILTFRKHCMLLLNLLLIESAKLSK